MKKIKNIFFFLLLLVSFSSFAFAAGKVDLEETANNLIKAIADSDEIVLRRITTPDFWSRSHNSFNEFFSQMARQIEATGGGSTLAVKNIKVSYERGVVTYNLILKSSGKILDTIYFYATIDGDMWVFIGLNKDKKAAKTYLRGTVPGSIL